MKSPYLRIIKKHNCFAFHFSKGENKCAIARCFGSPKINNLKVGVVAQYPVGSSCNVIFEQLEYMSKTVDYLGISE